VATPATQPFTFGGAVNFSAAPAPITITVGGVTETLILDQPVNSAADLAAALGSTVDTVVASGASLNASKLANLGLTVTSTGLVSASGLNITISGGSANTDTVTGLATSTGITSTDGVPGKGGDSFLIESTNKQGLLTTVARFSQAMKDVENTESSKKELSKIVAKTVANFENAITNIVSVQGEVGARQNMLQSSKDANADLELTGKEVLSQLEDLDYAEASTRLQMQSFVLSAAQQSFVKVSELSLFKYM
jgi:flagellar hook-associated protein 3 FlgL